MKVITPLHFRLSGLEWVKQVPHHWKVAPLYARYEVQLGKMLDASRITGNHLAPYLRNVDVQWGYINTADLPVMDFLPSDRVRFGLRVGDLLVCEGGEVGRCAIWNGELEECYYQKAIHRLRARSAEEYVRFFFYAMQAVAYSGAFVAGGNPNTIDHLTADKLRKHRFLFPPLEEQHAIADFLDRRTAQIDGVIAKKQRMIDLLHEKRQALISEAVTKGLDPEVPTKDSGIEWLGRVPRHWSVERLKYSITKIEQGWSPQCDNRPAEEDEWGVLKVGCGNGYEFDPTEQKALPLDVAPLPEYEVKPGDILMSRGNTRELVGAASLVKAVRPRLLLCDLLYRFHAQPRRADAEFLVFSLRSPYVRFQIKREASGTSASMKKVGQETIRELILCLPPVDEQKTITTRLRPLLDQHYEIVHRIESQITKLREYRQTLISAAVTGQIDVTTEGQR